MPSLVTRSRVKPLRILVSPAPPTLGAATFHGTSGIDVLGYKRIKGYFFTPTGAAAAGFPVITMGEDGVNFDLTFVIPQDLAQPAFTYTFDLEILSRFLTVGFTSGGGGANPFRCLVYLES